MKNKPSKISYMTHVTFSHLQDHIKDCKNKAHAEYCASANLIDGLEFDPDEHDKIEFTKKGNPRIWDLKQEAKEITFDSYRTQVRFYDDMLKQIEYAYSLSVEKEVNKSV